MLVVNGHPVALELACQLLRAGRLVAIPTETVYGLAADMRNSEAIARIFRVKARPPRHPLIVHVPNCDFARSCTSHFDERVELLSKSFWPGPLTLVLPRSEQVHPLITGGHSTVAIRIPSHPLTLELLRRFDGGLVAPSANRFTQVSPTSAADVAVELGHEVDLIIDGGPCQIGVESTVLDLSTAQPTILRPGAISAEAIELVLDQSILRTAAGTSTPSPGQHSVHYAPKVKVVPAIEAELWQLAAQHSLEHRRVRVICYCQRPADLQIPCEVQSFSPDLEQIARNLYARFRQADKDGVEILLMELPPNLGLGVAIRDRILRAAGQGSTLNS